MRVRNAVTGLAMVLVLGGCQRTFDTGYGNQQASLAPAPLQAQPVQTVQSNQLPAPGAPAAPGQFPAAPTQQTASLPGATPGVPGAAPAGGGMAIKKEAMVGNWKVSGGASCDMFLTLTNLGSGSRGGTRGCAGELTAMRSWEVAGTQVQFKDADGNVIGSVVKTADNRYDGRTSSGQPLTLGR